MKKTFLILSFFFCLPCFAQTYLDPNAIIEERVEDLLSRMTLEEKVGQMTQADRNSLRPVSDISNLFLGSVLSGGSSDPNNNLPQTWRDMVDTYQTEALKTRLKIPLMYGVDAVHGHNNVIGATILPHNIGLGCTRNPGLVQRAYAMMAHETAATNIPWTFAPCIAVPRNERWGRTYEGFGETAELAEMFSTAAVIGCQGDLAAEETILACAKHYIGDGGTTDGDDQGNTQIDEAALRAIHLPGYIKAIEAGVGSIMASFNSWNGTKCHGNKYLLTTLLKKELGFKGFIVSDWAGIDQIPGDYASDVEISINAGIDMVMVPDNYKEFISVLKTHVENGKVPMSRIDDAVRRILHQKFALGLFERPFTDKTMLDSLGSPAHRAIARQCVQQSLVVLKKKDGILPIAKNATRIHVAGRCANDIGNQCGGWTIHWQGSSGDITDGTTILEGIRNKTTGDVTFSLNGDNVSGADIGIAVIGETPYAEGFGDRNDLSLHSNDIATVRALKNAGIPVVVILVSGRPMIIDTILPFCDALIAAWLPGTEGDGVADVLFGDVQPKGTLSHTWPKSMEQIPVNQGDENYDPLFAYGFGISSLENSPVGADAEYYAAMANMNGRSIRLLFNKKMADPAGKHDQFSIAIDGNNILTPISIQLAATDSTAFDLYFDQKIENSDVINVTYQDGNIVAADGGSLALFIQQDVYNILNEISPAATIPAKIEAEDWSAMKGVRTENTSDDGGGLNVSRFDTGDWLEYFIYAPNSGVYDLNIRIAAPDVSGLLEILRDGIKIDELVIPVTGDRQTWQTITTQVELNHGNQILHLAAAKGGFNINWLQFILQTDVVDIKSPEKFEFLTSYPNPFNSQTTIKFYMKHAGHVKLDIYDINGREVRSLKYGFIEAGHHNKTWNARDNCGNIVPTGTYLLRFQTSEKSFIKKLTFLK